ncbi:hypothetical protein ABW02_06895 [Niallia circulans]|uniref:DUF3037 domain-containing protein n=1 Tax=Niallia circulans TaxID=1397 RepID=A0A0J1IMN0_NIACI|nr:DUF3037 domain-containing protein [Niallia circulans]KLV27241.1 hypothetical protein ABW02_06895 [Niallia circulans]
MEKGLFCTIEYLDSPIRNEHINIGIIIYSLAKNKIYIKINQEEAIKKIVNFYPFAKIDSIISMMDDLMQAIDFINAEKNINNKINELKITFKNNLRVSKEKKYMIEELTEDIHSLYEQQVCNYEDIIKWDEIANQRVQKSTISLDSNVYAELKENLSSHINESNRYENLVKDLVQKTVYESLGSKNELVERYLLNSDEVLKYNEEYLLYSATTNTLIDSMNNRFKQNFVPKRNVIGEYINLHMKKQNFDEAMNVKLDKTESFFQQKREVYV